MSNPSRWSKFQGAFQKSKEALSQLARKVLEQVVEHTPKNIGELNQLVKKSQGLFQKKNFSLYGKILTVLGGTFFIADLTALVVEAWIPEPPPVLTGTRASPGLTSSLSASKKSFESYSSIITRNLFNSRGLIPDEEGLLLGDGSGPAMRTTLPLNLVGTLVLRDEIRSLATIEDRGDAGRVYPVRITDEIPGKLRITKIEPYKVTFLNLSNRRMEFIDIPQDAQFSNPIVRPVSSAAPKGGIDQLSGTRFLVSRREVDSSLSNLNKILTEARAVPNFENGVAKGYKLFQIVPGSIYEKLGLQNGDVIHGVNGEPMVDPGKAFTMLSELKNTNHLELTINRNGKDQVMTYDIQ